MKIKIDTKNKKATLKGTGNESKILTVLAAFGGDALILSASQKNFFERAMGSGNFIDTLTIDLTHENITKEFIQLLLRLSKWIKKFIKI